MDSWQVVPRQVFSPCACVLISVVFVVFCRVGFLWVTGGFIKFNIKLPLFSSFSIYGISFVSTYTLFIVVPFKFRETGVYLCMKIGLLLLFNDIFTCK